MKVAHKVLNVLLFFSLLFFFVDLFVLQRDIASFTFGYENGPNRLLDHFYQYYQLDQSLNRNDLKKSLKNYIAKQNFQFKRDGYVIIRLIIDKNGKAEIFRFSNLDEKYNPQSTDLSNIESIISFLKNKQDWQKGFVNNKERKYHYIIRLKIINGQINEIY